MADGKSILDIIILVFYLGGIVGLGFLIKSLKGTIDTQGRSIDAQGKTIEAQGAILTEFKDLSATMKGVLESTDEPKMLERVKAYKEFVDKEKAAAISEMEKKHAKGFQMSVEAIKGLIGGELEVLSTLVPYVPYEERRRIIDSLQLEGNFPGIRDGFHKLAEVAIDLSSPEKRTAFSTLPSLFGGLFPEGPPKLPEQPEPGGKLKERITKGTR